VPGAGVRAIKSKLSSLADKFTSFAGYPSTQKVTGTFWMEEWNDGVME
jgi:hypothetical protein